MRVNCYSIFDMKSLTYGTPFFSLNESVARRDFGDLTREPSSTVFRHPEDFRLFHVGVFDLDNGVFDSLTSPHFVCDALEFSDSRVSDPRVSDFTFGGFRDDEV